VTDRGFPKSRRLRKRQDYLLLSKKGFRVQNQHFIALFLPGITGRTRVGITTSKKVGNAVTRNRIKRSIREHFRTNSNSFSTCLDISIIARKSAAGLNAEQVHSSLKNLFMRIKEKSVF
jgi:ribonuclease P protein component